MNTINLFWDWIQFNEKTLRNLQTEKSNVQKLFLFWLKKHLHYYCPELDAIIMFPTKENKDIRLIISANGNPEYFGLITTLVDNSPKVKNWKFLAFIQPSEDIEEMEAGLDKPYVFKDINLKVSELKFMPFRYEGIKKIDMIVYLKNFTVHCNNKNLLQVVFIIMQNVIGEKSLYENISFIELAQMPEKQNDEMIYLFDLRYYLDEINNPNSKFK